MKYIESKEQFRDLVLKELEQQGLDYNNLELGQKMKYTINFEDGPIVIKIPLVGPVNDLAKEFPKLWDEVGLGHVAIKANVDIINDENNAPWHTVLKHQRNFDKETLGDYYDEIMKEVNKRSEEDQIDVDNVLKGINLKSAVSVKDALAFFYILRGIRSHTLPIIGAIKGEEYLLILSTLLALMKEDKEVAVFSSKEESLAYRLYVLEKEVYGFKNIPVYKSSLVFYYLFQQALTPVFKRIEEQSKNSNPFGMASSSDLLSNINTIERKPASLLKGASNYKKELKLYLIVDAYRATTSKPTYVGLLRLTNYFLRDSLKKMIVKKDKGMSTRSVSKLINERILDYFRAIDEKLNVNSGVYLNDKESKPVSGLQNYDNYSKFKMSSSMAIYDVVSFERKPSENTDNIELDVSLKLPRYGLRGIYFIVKIDRFDLSINRASNGGLTLRQSFLKRCYHTYYREELNPHIVLDYGGMILAFSARIASGKYSYIKRYLPVI